MTPTNGKLKTENRLSTLEANYKSLNDKVEEIANNHLQHIAEDIKEIQNSVNKIDLKLAYWSGIIVAFLYILEKFLA